MTYGFSRDDAGKFLDAYYDAKIFENDPFAKLDQVGVGKLMKMAIELGKPVNPSLHVGICGEHGGDPSSVEFCDSIGLLHQGQLLLTQSLDQIKCSVCKLQCVISDPHKEQQFLSSIKILKMERSGSLLTLIITEATQIFFLRYRLMILFLQKSFRLHSKKYL